MRFLHRDLDIQSLILFVFFCQAAGSAQRTPNSCIIFHSKIGIYIHSQNTNSTGGHSAPQRLRVCVCVRARVPGENSSEKFIQFHHIEFPRGIVVLRCCSR